MRGEEKKCKTFFLLVGVRGLEPPTSWSQTRRASQLRYTPIEMMKKRKMQGEEKKCEAFFLLVGVRRLELPTSRTPCVRASQLRHTPT